MSVGASPQKVCPGCGGTEFYCRATNIGGYAACVMPAGFFGAMQCEVRVCSQCRRVDWFVTEAAMEYVVKKKYELRR